MSQSRAYLGGELIAQVPLSGGGIVEQNDGFFSAKDMDPAVKATQGSGGADGIRQGKGGLPRTAFPKAENPVLLVFSILIRKPDLNGQNAAIGLVLADDFDIFSHCIIQCLIHESGLLVRVRVRCSSLTANQEWFIDENNYRTYVLKNQ